MTIKKNYYIQLLVITIVYTSLYVDNNVGLGKKSHIIKKREISNV